MSNIPEEYRTIVSGAGLLSRAHFGRLEFAGRDATTFLQALLTNDLTPLARGRGIYSAYLTPQGRMIADLELHVVEDRLMAEVAPGTAATLAARFDQLIFAEDVRVVDVSDSTSAVTVVGGAAAEVVGRVLGVSRDALEQLREPDDLAWDGGLVARAGESPLPMFKVFCVNDERHHVEEKFHRTGAVDLSDSLSEAMRIEAGRPRFGVDLGSDTIPLEAGLLDRGISTTKGCYVGQEIIIRMLHRGGGRVARRVAILSTPFGGATPVTGSPLLVDDREVGRLTSVAPALDGAGFVALGPVARDYAHVGQTLAMGGVTGARATITGFTR